MRFRSVLYPRRLRTFAPAPVFAMLVSCTGPLPEASMVGTPVVPERPSVRVTTSPGPTYSRLAAAVSEPRKSEPPPTLLPKLLEPAPAAPRERTMRAPAVTVVFPL